METADAFARAIAQFNAGEFFDCHETLEPLWQSASGQERVFLHALIQAAIALCHLQRGNQIGAFSLYTRAQSKFKDLPRQMSGIDIQRLALELEAFFATVYASHAETISYPTIRLKPDYKFGV